MQNPQVENFLIAFCDLTGFGKLSRRNDDAAVFAFLSGLYELIGEVIESAGGRVIKFIADTALVVFEEAGVDAGVRALKELKSRVDTYTRKNGFDSTLVVKAHFGSAVCGMLGTKSGKLYDIIGNAVNIAAALESHGFAISVEVFRKLKPETRKLFKKHTPPVTYIDIEERHR